MTVWSVLSSEVGGWAVAITSAFLGAVWLFFKGRSDAKKDQQIQEYERDLTAHERMNHADTGADLDDDARRERLRDFAKQHGH